MTKFGPKQFLEINDYEKTRKKEERKQKIEKERKKGKEGRGFGRLHFFHFLSSFYFRFS